MPHENHSVQPPTHAAESAPVWPTHEWPTEEPDLAQGGVLNTPQIPDTRAQERQEKEVAEADAQAEVRAAFEQPEQDTTSKLAQPSSSKEHPVHTPKPAFEADHEKTGPISQSEIERIDREAAGKDHRRVAAMSDIELAMVDPKTLHPDVRRSSSGFKDMRYKAVERITNAMRDQLAGKGNHQFTREQVIAFANHVYETGAATRYSDDVLQMDASGSLVPTPESQELENQVAELYESAVGNPLVNVNSVPPVPPPAPKPTPMSSPKPAPAPKPESPRVTHEDADRQKARDDADLVTGMSDAQLALLNTRNLHPSVRDSEELRNRRFKGASDVLDDVFARIQGQGSPVTKLEVLNLFKKVDKEQLAVMLDKNGMLTPESNSLMSDFVKLYTLVNKDSIQPNEVLNTRNLHTSLPPVTPPTPSPVRPPRPTLTSPPGGSSTPAEKRTTTQFYGAMQDGEGNFIGNKMLGEQLTVQGGTADEVLRGVFDRIGGDHINTKGFATAGEYVYDTLDGITFEGMTMTQATQARETLGAIQKMADNRRFSRHFTKGQLQAIGWNIWRAQAAIDSIKSKAAPVPIEIPTEEYKNAHRHFVGPLSGESVPDGKARATANNTPWTALSSRVNKVKVMVDGKETEMTQYEARVREDMAIVDAAKDDPKTIAWILNLPKEYITPPARERAFLLLARNSELAAEEQAAQAEADRIDQLETPLAWGKLAGKEKISGRDPLERPYFIASALIDRKKRYEASGTADPKSTTEMEANAVSGLITMAVEGMKTGDTAMTSDALFALKELTKNIPTTDKPILHKSILGKKYNGQTLRQILEGKEIGNPLVQDEILTFLNPPPKGPSLAARSIKNTGKGLNWAGNKIVDGAVVAIKTSSKLADKARAARNKKTPPKP